MAVHLEPPGRAGLAEEMAGAFAAALERTDGPTLLALTRQAVPMLNEASVQDRRAGVLKGGYVLIKETAPLTHILLASGSEVQWAVAAAKQLGGGARVVSVPSFLRFDAQPKDYRESVLPRTVTRRVTIEAGATLGWERYAGDDGAILGIDHYGASAPAGTICANSRSSQTEHRSISAGDGTRSPPSGRLPGKQRQTAAK